MCLADPSPAYSPAPLTEPFVLLLLQLLAVPNTIVCMQALEVHIFLAAHRSALDITRTPSFLLLRQMSHFLVSVALSERCRLLADFVGGQVFSSVLSTLLTEV